MTGRVPGFIDVVRNFDTTELGKDGMEVIVMMTVFVVMQKLFQWRTLSFPSGQRVGEK